MMSAFLLWDNQILNRVEALDAYMTFFCLKAIFFCLKAIFIAKITPKGPRIEFFPRTPYRINDMSALPALVAA